MMVLKNDDDDDKIHNVFLFSRTEMTIAMNTGNPLLFLLKRLTELLQLLLTPLPLLEAVKVVQHFRLDGRRVGLVGDKVPCAHGRRRGLGSLPGPALGL